MLSITRWPASRDFRQLVRSGLLVPHGASRGRYYTAGRDLVALRRRIIDARDARDDSDPFAA